VQCQGLATVPPVGFVEGLNAKRKGLQASSQSRAARAPERPQESRNDSGQGVSLPDTLNTPQRAIQTAFTVRRPERANQVAAERIIIGLHNNNKNDIIILIMR